jgi:hypothetical protein
VRQCQHPNLNVSELVRNKLLCSDSLELGRLLPLQEPQPGVDVEAGPASVPVHSTRPLYFESWRTLGVFRRAEKRHVCFMRAK